MYYFRHSEADGNFKFKHKTFTITDVYLNRVMNYVEAVHVPNAEVAKVAGNKKRYI